MRRLLGLALAGSLGVVLLGGGARAAPPAVRTQLAGGISLAVPAGWHVARGLTDLLEPRERFTLASFPLRRPPHPRCGPTAAVSSIPADGALAFVIEYRRGRLTRGGFGPQPSRFALPTGPPAQYECFGRGWSLGFRAAGRSFQVMIALGRNAVSNRSRLLRALSSLRIVRAQASD